MGFDGSGSFFGSVVRKVQFVLVVLVFCLHSSSAAELFVLVSSQLKSNS